MQEPRPDRPRRHKEPFDMNRLVILLVTILVLGQAGCARESKMTNAILAQALEALSQASFDPTKGDEAHKIIYDAHEPAHIKFLASHLYDQRPAPLNAAVLGGKQFTVGDYVYHALVIKITSHRGEGSAKNPIPNEIGTKELLAERLEKSEYDINITR